MRVSIRVHGGGIGLEDVAVFITQEQNDVAAVLNQQSELLRRFLGLFVLQKISGEASGGLLQLRKQIEILELEADRGRDGRAVRKRITD